MYIYIHVSITQCVRRSVDICACIFIGLFVGERYLSICICKYRYVYTIYVYIHTRIHHPMGT